FPVANRSLEAGNRPPDFPLFWGQGKSGDKAQGVACGGRDGRFRERETRALDAEPGLELILVALAGGVTGLTHEVHETRLVRVREVRHEAHGGRLDGVAARGNEE